MLDTAAAKKIADIVLFHQLPRDSDWKMKNTAKAAVLAVTEIIAAPTMYSIL
jgi:DNA-binding MurR/RpiR family transcriptional regulator